MINRQQRGGGEKKGGKTPSSRYFLRLYLNSGNRGCARLGGEVAPLALHGIDAVRLRKAAAAAAAAS